jgi:hypothetical protein
MEEKEPQSVGDGGGWGEENAGAAGIVLSTAWE